MPTIKDVAKLANVSTATVSAALNGTAYVSPQLKERVERAVQKLGYSAHGVARNLKKGVSNLIGLIIDDVTSPFYAELVEAIEAAAYAEGYNILLCHTGQDIAKERKYLSLLKTHRVGGIVWAPTGKSEDYPAAEFEHFSIPLVFVDRVVSTFQSYDSVLLNNRATGMQATNYLLDLGHRRIGVISGSGVSGAGARAQRRLPGGLSEAWARCRRKIDPQRQFPRSRGLRRLQEATVG